MTFCVNNLPIVKTGAGDDAPQLGKVTILDSSLGGAADYSLQSGRVTGLGPCVGEAMGCSVMGQGLT